MKDPSYAPTYCALYPALANIARSHGYALAIHGTLGRDVIQRELTPAELAAFRGVVGHYHWSPKRKIDPGLALMRAIAGFEPRLAIGLGGPAE